MHFTPAFIILAALATSVVADRMEVVEACFEVGGGGCHISSATFFTDFGAYGVDANDGCRSTSVPGMVEFCVDVDDQRGHFRFDHQNFRRCMRRTSTRPSPPGFRSEWTEVACTWKEVPVDVTVASVSAIGIASEVPVGTGVPA